MVGNVSKWMLCVILLLSALCFFIAESSGKNEPSLTNSTSIESKNPGSGTAETVNIPVTDSIYKPGFTFVTGVGKKTLLRTISPEEVKIQSFAGNGMDGSASGRNSSSDESSIFNSSDLSLDSGSLRDSFISGIDSGNFNRPETMSISQPTPTYNIQNITTDGICREFPTGGVFAAGDLIHHQINLTGSSISIFTKNNKFPFGVMGPGKSWTSSEMYSVALDNMNNNGSSNIKSSNGTAYDQVSPQSGRMNTYKYTTVQPVSPPLKALFPNTSYLGERSHYVGADGHTITLMNNESAVDPSYEQLVEFIKKDKTNEIPYNNTSFVCSDAAERVHNNAEKYGFRCAWVYIDFKNELATLNPTTKALVIGHSCNLFNTTDRGLVAIDCTGGSSPTDNDAGVDLSKWDNEVSLVKNGEYTPRLLYSFPGSDKLRPFLSMGTVDDYYLFW